MKRNFKGFLVDLLVPSLLIAAGFGLSSIEFYSNSGQRVLEPSLFPLPQRIMYNSNNINGGGDPETLINLLLPSSAFSPSSVAVSGSSDKELLENFDNLLYNSAVTDSPDTYRYGHYYFNRLDYKKHQYKVVTFINATSQEANVAFPQFMYEAILKNAISDSLSYKMVNDPMPIAQVYKDGDKSTGGIFIGFVLGIAFALIPASIIGFILNERSEALAHQQVISGMNKVAYWASNFVFDVAKTIIPVLVAIAFMYIYDLNIEYAWLLLLLFPIAIVPYTYATSFLFSNEATAQNLTIIHHFLIGGMMPIIVFALRLIKKTRDIGDILMWIPRIVPTYNAIGGLMTITLRDTVANTRREDVPHALSFKAAGGDVMFLVLHFFLWNFLLFLIEIGCFNFLRSKGKTIIDPLEELDEDVIREKKRVENTPEDQLAVKADHLRKVYGDKVAVKDTSFGLDFGD